MDVLRDFKYAIRGFAKRMGAATDRPRRSSLVDGEGGNCTNALAVPRDCANDRLPGSQRATRVDLISTVVRLTARRTVNCPNVSCSHHDCALVGWDPDRMVLTSTVRTVTRNCDHVGANVHALERGQFSEFSQCRWVVAHRLGQSVPIRAA